IHTKGIILRALDQFRLKSCIDFKQCYSYIGRVNPNGQVLSIGAGCEYVHIVEHEMLHALGFYHEQSRYDRDDYVTIVWDNILKGREYNFNKVPSDESTTHGTPYDYWSVMHYSKDAFTNGNGSTIITIDPKFQDIIGQSLEMSYYDVQELNLLYKCNSTIAFNMYCGFSNGTLCGMDRCSQGNMSWELVTQVITGPSSDHTTLPGGIGYFMHVSTAAGQEGDTAQLETQRMTPKRDCHIQCLQFYYYHSGDESDVLNIWIREFKNEQDSTGTRHIKTIDSIFCSKTSHWKLHHVSLNATKNFQVVFEAQNGVGRSTGGFSVDDINLHETECPHLTLQIDDFQTVLETTTARIYSSRQYSSEGYAFRFGALFFGTHFGLYMQLLSGDYDDQLDWPCLRRQMTFQMLDQTPNIQQQMAKRWSFTTNEYHVDPNGVNYFDNPRKIGSAVFTDENNKQVYGGILYGLYRFSTLEEMQNREFLKGGSAVFTLNFQGKLRILLSNFRIDDFQTVLETTTARIYSSRQYSSEGYAFQFGAFFFGTHFGLYMQLLSGDYDDQLDWPCLRRQMTFQMLDQTPNIQQQMAKRWSFTTNEYHVNPNGKGVKT
uniref:Metalloendopeptidase n=1 Tax=Oryzias melastigma TaxID=30732 RepID=A0A3B3DRJ7_ORYME